MDNVSRDTEILRRNKTEMLETESKVAEMKNAFHGIIQIRKKIHKLGHRSMETSQTESQEKAEW